MSANIIKWNNSNYLSHMKLIFCHEHLFGSLFPNMPKELDLRISPFREYHVDCYHVMLVDNFSIL